MTDSLLSFSPTTPPRLHIEPLPKQAILAAVSTGLGTRGQAVAMISTWLPDRWCGMELSGGYSDSEFIEDNCANCEYNCDSRRLEGCGETIEDAEGVEWTINYAYCHSPCTFYEDGLSGVNFPCCMGHDEPDGTSDDEVSLSAMCFTAWRCLDPERPFKSQDIRQDAFTAELRKAALVDGIWRQTASRRSINCYDDGGICWGNNNDLPSSLADAADTYAEAEGNGDLLDPSSFIANNDWMACTAVDRINSAITELHLAVPPADVDQALLVASAALNPQAFLLLTASGFKQQGGLVIALAAWSEAHNAWITRNTSSDHHWLVGVNPTDWEGNEGILLGQLHNTELQPPLTSCDSPEPSSSALAALAAS